MQAWAPARKPAPAAAQQSLNSLGATDTVDYDRFSWTPGQTRDLSYTDVVGVPHPALAYELVQGSQAYWDGPASGATTAPPTAVLVHGILGHRGNLRSFADLLVQRNPSWQVLLVDLRCHGESASLPGRQAGEGPHSVASAASDILALLRQLKLFPRVLIGHSFGGKVVMSMVHQFPAKLPRPVQVWVLDCLPGEVRPSAGSTLTRSAGDDPERLIALLRSIPTPVVSRQAVIDTVLRAGFTMPIARWVVTNLRRVAAPPAGSGSGSGSGNGASAGQPGGLGYTYYGGNGAEGGGVSWTFDLNGVAELYRSYLDTQLWDVIERPPQGLQLDFVKAERSAYSWRGDEDAIRGAGHNVHLLPNSGHWVSTDNPDGLYELLAASLHLAPSLSSRRAAADLRQAAADRAAARQQHPHPPPVHAYTLQLHEEGEAAGEIAAYAD
ncbi:hypothetical protein HYH02_014759 [Chlamydomonas schloesseri]|uniref:AB hydrolase-1 domain-containing protein n=1 Tax=Chlamydomonas schloesseri TaxID=2026947 RepID=A0A835VV69_9CHLO|nr:hypothetical protein HYH02_014759 [Chlamydomonas schloesseri]|eukprot:KAG2426719.1 hypothetical protein HYH02_014759 [Chlamydomonas schloesseri]